MDKDKEFQDDALPKKIKKKSRQTALRKAESYTAHNISQLDLKNKTNQPQSENLLRESEERFSKFLDITPDAVVVHFNKIVISVNDNTIKLFGAKNRNELIGKPIMQFIHPEDQKAAGNRIEAMYKSNTPAPIYEERMLKLDGSEVFVEVIATLVPYNDKKATLVILRDITELKNVESKRRESEERYELIFKNSMDAILLSSPEGNIYSANPAACNMFQMNEEEICNAGRKGLVDTSDPRLTGLLKERQNTGKTKGELLMLRKDGTKFPVEFTSALFYNSNNELRTSMIIRDITERKNAEKEAQEREEQFRLLFMSINEGFYISEVIYDNDGNPCDYRYIEVNKRFEEILGLSREQIIGKRYKEIVPVDTTNWLEKYFEVASTGKNKSYEFYSEEYKKYFGTYSYSPFKGQVIVFVMDITERRKVEKELQESYDLLNKLTDQVPGVVYQYRLYPDGSSAFPISSSGMWDIYEVTPEEVKEDASPVFTRIHLDDYDMIVDTINESAKNLTMYHSEFRVILPKQGLRWRLCDAKPERLEDGSILWYGIITDITERKQAEEELKKYRNQLEELVKERTADLEKKNTELEKFNDLFVGREFRIKELKNKVEELEQQIKANG